jgi:hypothetical protein
MRFIQYVEAGTGTFRYQKNRFAYIPGCSASPYFAGLKNYQVAGKQTCIFFLLPTDSSFLITSLSGWIGGGMHMHPVHPPWVRHWFIEWQTNNKNFQSAFSFQSASVPA